MGHPVVHLVDGVSNKAGKKGKKKKKTGGDGVDAAQMQNITITTFFFPTVHVSAGKHS